MNIKTVLTFIALPLELLGVLWACVQKVVIVGNKSNHLVTCERVCVFVCGWMGFTGRNVNFDMTGKLLVGRRKGLTTVTFL